MPDPVDSSNPYQELPQAICPFRIVRESMGLSQREVAARAGIIEWTVIQLELGNYEATLLSLRGISSALHVDIGWLVTRYVEWLDNREAAGLVLKKAKKRLKVDQGNQNGKESSCQKDSSDSVSSPDIG